MAAAIDRSTSAAAPIVSSPDMAPIGQPIVGYRVFVSDGWSLRGLASVIVTEHVNGRRRDRSMPGPAWPIGSVADAECGDRLIDRVAHLAPAIGCRCGLHAVDSLATLQRVIDRDRDRRIFRRRDLVIAAVQMWGDKGRSVIVGETERGGLQLRSPHAIIAAIAPIDQRRRSVRLARSIGDRLGVAVIDREHLEAVARERVGVQLRAPIAERSITAIAAAAIGAVIARIGRSVIARMRPSEARSIGAAIDADERSIDRWRPARRAIAVALRVAYRSVRRSVLVAWIVMWRLAPLALAVVLTLGAIVLALVMLVLGFFGLAGRRR